MATTIIVSKRQFSFRNKLSHFGVLPQISAFHRSLWSTNSLNKNSSFNLVFRRSIIVWFIFSEMNYSSPQTLDAKSKWVTLAFHVLPRLLARKLANTLFWVYNELTPYPQRGFALSSKCSWQKIPYCSLPWKSKPCLSLRVAENS